LLRPQKLAWLGILGSLLLLPSIGEAQPVAFQCRVAAGPASPVVTSYDTGVVGVGTVALGTGLFCRNVQAVPVQFVFVDNNVPPTAAGGGFYVWAWCLFGSCIDGTPPRLVQPDQDILIPITLYPLRPGSFAGSLTIRNSSGFAFTTIQLTGQAALIAVPAVQPGGIAILAGVLALEGWLKARRL